MTNKISAIAVFDKNIKGYVLFKELDKKVKIEIKLKNVKKGIHGFHIHESGNLLEGCESCKSHFNPFNKNHGDINSKERHLGDLGNIEADSNNKVNTIFYDNQIKLRGTKRNIIGRSVIIHKNKDDLGLGNNKESLKTGNAGERIGCAVIGYAKPIYF